MDFERKARYNVSDLVDIVRLLREPGGCPWDREQTHASLRKNLIEETYEVAEAIDCDDAHLLCEELGDLLLQVLMHARIEEEAGRFTFEDVCDGICKKLVYRHPHVFGEEAHLSSDEVLHNWEALKNTEKGRETAADRLDSVPASLPALMRSAKVQKRAGDFGFGYADAAAALADLDAEVRELAQAVAQDTPQRAADEVGDVLFAAVNVARLVDADAEEALTRSCERFAKRVKAVEQSAEAAGKPLAAIDAAERDAWWREAKQRENP